MRAKRNLLWTMRVTTREMAQIVRLAEREGRSASEVVRSLVAEAEQTKRAPAPQQDGALPVSGP